MAPRICALVAAWICWSAMPGRWPRGATMRRGRLRRSAASDVWVGCVGRGGGSACTEFETLEPRRSTSTRVPWSRGGRVVGGAPTSGLLERARELLSDQVAQGAIAHDPRDRPRICSQEGSMACRITSRRRHETRSPAPTIVFRYQAGNVILGARDGASACHPKRDPRRRGSLFIRRP